MKRLQARYTGIREILDVGDGFVVLEDFEKYPEGLSNLYKITYSFDVVWDAELPRRDSVYLDKLTIENPGVLKAFTWNDCRCYIDLKNGKLLEKHWTK